jgi:hypothetical protein
VIEARGTNGRVTFDGGLVTIHRGGARSWVRGAGVRSIPARALVAVDLQPAGFGRGWIRFAVEGADDEDGDLDDAYDDAYDEEDGDDGDEGGTGSPRGGDGGVGELLGLGGLLGRSRRPAGGKARARAKAKAKGPAAFDPARDPNTVLFSRARQRDFEDVRREVKTAMWEASRRGGADDPDPTPTRPLPPDDPVRELRQLGQLLRDGVISRAEFERAKSRLLDRI